MNAIVPNTALQPCALTPEAAAVRQALVDAGLETPMLETGLSHDEKYLRLEQSFTDVLSTLGLGKHLAWAKSWAPGLARHQQLLPILTLWSL